MSETKAPYRTRRTSRKAFLHFLVDVQLLVRIDDFRWAGRYPSRAAAISALIQSGLERVQEKTGEAL